VKVGEQLSGAGTAPAGACPHPPVARNGWHWDADRLDRCEGIEVGWAEVESTEGIDDDGLRRQTPGRDAPGRILPGWSRSTTASGAAVGAWRFTPRVSGAPRLRQNRAEKEVRVREGRAHAALVYDGSACVGWCQFGPTDELPRIKRQRAYDQSPGELPDWRISCFFVDKGYRQQGVASAALDGALREIARLGGGTVESYPEAVEDRSVSGSFLHNATVSMFERHGFERIRPLGKHHWLMTRTVRKASKTAAKA